MLTNWCSSSFHSFDCKLNANDSTIIYWPSIGSWVSQMILQMDWGFESVNVQVGGFRRDCSWTWSHTCSWWPKTGVDRIGTPTSLSRHDTPIQRRQELPYHHYVLQTPYSPSPLSYTTCELATCQTGSTFSASRIFLWSYVVTLPKTWFIMRTPFVSLGELYGEGQKKFFFD